MHIEYAAEQFKRLAQPKRVDPAPDQKIVEMFVSEKEFLALAINSGNEKAAAIAETIRNNTNKYSRVTAKQAYVIASELLNKHSTAKAVFAAAFGVSEEQFGEIVESV